MKLQAIHIGLDLYASPIWTAGPDGRLESRSLGEFPFSAGLARDLAGWAATYDRLAESHDGDLRPQLPGLQDVDSAGEEFWRRAVAELGADRDVHYDSPVHGESHLVHRTEDP